VLWGDTPPWTGYGRNSRAELSTAPEAPSQEYNNRVTENLLSLGASPRVAEWLGPKLGGALQMFSPVGVVTSAEDAAYHADRGEYPAMVAASLGLIPAAGRPVGKIAERAMHAAAQDGNSLAAGAAWLSRRSPGQVAVAEEVRPFHAARQNVDEAGPERMGDAQAGIHAFPELPEMTAKQYYGKVPIEVDKENRILRTREGYVLDPDVETIGHVTLDGKQNAVTPEKLERIVEIATGQPARPATRAELDGAIGDYRWWVPDKIRYLDQLVDPTKHKVIGHEFGHHVHEVSPGMVQAVGKNELLQRELLPVFSHGYEGGSKVPLTTPQDKNYKGIEVAQELTAELVRAYLTAPNYIKTVAPQAAEFLRRWVNGHPELSKIIQLNSIAGGAVLLGAGSAPQEATRRANEF
jgi:hypothetical protein